MRILFFSHYFPPEGNAPANRTYEHCTRWAASGHDVTVVTCAPNVPNGIIYPGYRNRLRPQEEVVDGIRVVRVWTFLAPNAGTAKRIINFLSYMVTAVLATLFRKRPDVIVATSPQFFCGWAGVIASWLKWRPLVLEIRDIWPESILTVGAMKRGFAIRVLERLERWMYRSASWIVAVGDGYRDNILSKIDVADQISVIPNGVDLAAFQPREGAPEFRYQWRLGDRFVCAYVGTLGMAHGLEIAIRAAVRLKAAGRDDICFLLVGDGAERESLEARSREAGVDDLVRFTGRMSRTEMPTVLACCDAALVHLHGTELFETVIPSKIFETMAMQRPIIMGVRGNALQIVTDAKAGVPLTPDDDAELTEIVQRLADNPHERVRLAEQGRAFVQKYYNRDLLAAEYLALLTAVATGASPAYSAGDLCRQRNSEIDQPHPAETTL